MNTRQGITGLWVVVTSVGLVSGIGGATPAGGLLEPSVCLSAGTLLVLVLTPTATLSEYATNILKSRIKNNG